jgi:uncharacterized membrane protein YkgB
MKKAHQPTIEEMDRDIIHFFRMVSDPLARFGLFVVFFWFGLLKVLGQSPASAMVQNLFEKTIPFMQFSTFIVLFGLFEMLIGVMFIIKGWEREVIPLLFIHMVTTCMPLLLLRSETWSGFLVPTMEGQYIIKNLVIIATAIAVAAHIHPLPRKKQERD